MSKAEDLHGSAPHKSSQVLILIDVINDLSFPEGKKLLRYALPAAKKISALKKRAVKAGIPVVYVNDNFGLWQSDFRKHVKHCLDDDSLGKPITELLKPGDDDYFVLKPKHSGFYSTTLEILLRHLNAESLILAGFAGDICVLFTANDAYMRDFKVTVPRDCIASETKRANEYALAQMKRYLKANIAASSSIRF